MTPAEFEKRVKELVGHRIARVRYHEIDYHDANGKPLPDPMWSWCPDFDSLDHGLDFTMEDGTVFYLTWGAEFEQYGLTIQRDALHDVSAVRVWDVTGCSRWTPLLGQEITAAGTFWSWISPGENGAERSDYPQDIQLTFESGERVFLSAYEVREDGFRMGMMDNVTVFFDSTVAESHQVGPFAQLHRAAEPTAAGRRRAPTFLRWLGLGVYVALLTALPSALRG